MKQRKRGAGFQKPRTEPDKAKPVGLARISYEGNTATCSCGGWSGFHVRVKVLEDRIDRHLKRKHGGMGIRL